MCFKKERELDAAHNDATHARERAQRDIAMMTESLDTLKRALDAAQGSSTDKHVSVALWHLFERVLLVLFLVWFFCLTTVWCKQTQLQETQAALQRMQTRLVMARKREGCGRSCARGTCAVM